MAHDVEAPNAALAPTHRHHRPEHKPRTLRVPRFRTLVVGVLVAMLAAMLVIDAYVNASLTPNPAKRSDVDSLKVPESIKEGGPIIDTAQGQYQSYDLPPKTVALTFDDGPSAEWTPQILAVLRKYHVPATFFLIGGQVIRNQAITQQILAQGSEIGVHTFTHPDLTTVGSWRRGIEYSQTEMAIAAVTGTTTSLLRYPYSSSPDALSDADWQVAKEAGRRGFLTVLTSVDSDDWQIHNAKAIIHNATPPNDDGAIVLMHDAGGDRSQTVKALDEYLPMMLANGWKFTTVTEGLRLALAAGGTSPAAGNEGSQFGDVRASPSEVWRGRALISVIQVAGGFVRLLELLFLIVGVLTIARTILVFAVAGYHAATRRSRDWSWGPPVTEPVSVVVPAYNEKEGIVAAVRSLATGDHPGGIEVVVVDDGSTDGTGMLVEAMRLPNVRVIRVPNGGKPHALNVGIAYARHELIVMVDGDTVVEPDAIRQLVQPFADRRIGAVSGNVKVGNRTGILARWQHIEYVIGFNLDRRLYDVLQCMPTIPGAIGAFRREALRHAGGVSADTLAEDTDLTMAVIRSGWGVVYNEKARAWTEAPATLKQLIQQRYRWSYGTIQAMWKHRHSVVEKGPSGHFGRVGLPMLTMFGVLLPLLAPLFDLVTLYGFFVLNVRATGIAWLIMLALQLGTAYFAFKLDKESTDPLWALPLQQFVYRQVMYLVIIRSVLTALTGGRLRWQKLHRMGQTGLPTQQWGEQRSGRVPAQ